MKIHKTENDLSEREYSILHKIKTVSGLIDSMETQIDQLKVSDIYRGIHKEYTDLDSLEALKRAVFIQWYSASEPQIYTGLGTLDKKKEEQNIQKVNELVNSNKLDKEFEIMLKYYHSVNDWYFNCFADCESLKNLLGKKTELPLKEIKIMISRGQMGEYWNSLNR